MAVKVTKRIYNEIYKDESTDWLLGNTGDWQKANINVEVGIEFFASTQSPITIDQINNTFVLASGGNWGSLGFDNGMTLVFRYVFEEDTDGNGSFDFEQTVEQTFEILNVSGPNMDVDAVINSNDFENLPTNFGTRRVTNVHLFVEQEAEGCRITYGHIPNADLDSQSLASVIDGSETQFVLPDFSGIPEGQFVEMEPIGLQSGMSIRNVKVRKMPSGSDDALLTYNAPTSSSRSLNIIDFSILQPIYQTARSIIMNNDVVVAGYKSQENDELIPQNPNTAAFLNGSEQQAFIFNAPQSYSQQAFVNQNIKILAQSQLGSNTFKFGYFTYENGASMDFLSFTSIMEWDDVQQYVGQTLNFNGFVDFNVTGGESFVLGVVLDHPGPFNNITRSLVYAIEDGVMQLSQKNEIFSSDIKKKYEFEINYMISSLFDTISNLQDNELPQYLEGDGSLTDNFRIEFFPEWNNPNVFIQNELDKTARQGNTGWFNENFNELANDFEIESVQYLDENGNTVDSLDYTQKTKATITILGVPNINQNTECGFGFAWVPINEEDYKDNTTPFYRNVFTQSGDENNGFPVDQLFPGPYIGAGVNGASMDAENVKFTKVSNKIVCEVTLVPNGAFLNTFESKDETDRNFVLWVSVADSSLGRNFTDRVSLIADFGALLKNIPPAGPYPLIDNSFIDHPFDETGIGESFHSGIIQDDILCRLPFKIPTDGSEVFQRIRFGVDAFNISENRSFDLESFDIDLTSFPIDSNGIHQIDFNEERGFKLDTGNNKNFVKVNRNEPLDSSGLSAYIALYALKIRWEDWIENGNAPNDFFNALQDNDGFHNDWINYLNTEGWTINLFVEIVSEMDGELVEYKNRFEFDFKDYDQHENISVTHEYFRDSNDALLNIGVDPETGTPLGAILSNEPTRIEIEYTITDGGVWDIAKSYAVTTIEIDRGSGEFEQRQLSSVHGSEGDNPLKPLSGQAKLKLEVDVTNKKLKASCLVDPDLLEDASRYRITGRVGCFDDTGVVYDGGIHEAAFESAYE